MPSQLSTITITINVCVSSRSGRGSSVYMGFSFCFWKRWGGGVHVKLGEVGCSSYF